MAKRMEPLHGRLGQTSTYLESPSEREVRKLRERETAARAIAQYEAWLEDASGQLPGSVRSERLRIRKRAAAIVRDRVLRSSGDDVLFPEISDESRLQLASQLAQAVRTGKPYDPDLFSPVR